MGKIKNIFFTSLVLTVLIFCTAMMLNYGLDFYRLNSILGTMQEHEISYEAYVTEQSFIEAFGGNKCETMKSRIEFLKEEIEDVGAELSSYGRISFFRKWDYEYLERKYFLLELKFLALVENLNKECGEPYIPILFFYEADADISERQGYILAEISKKYTQKVIVLSIDKDYSKEPLVEILVAKHNVTEAPTTIISSNIKYEGLVYEKEIESAIENISSNQSSAKTGKGSSKNASNTSFSTIPYPYRYKLIKKFLLKPI